MSLVVAMHHLFQSHVRDGFTTHTAKLVKSKDSCILVIYSGRTWRQLGLTVNYYYMYYYKIRMNSQLKGKRKEALHYLFDAIVMKIRKMFAVYGGHLGCQI